MSIPTQEVLVVPESRLAHVEKFCGLLDNSHQFLDFLLDPAHFLFIPRAEAENDPTYKQLIPYVVLQHGDSYFAYQRGKGGGEKRLHARYSIGIGGHIERTDGPISGDLYRTGMMRELQEEVQIGTTWRETLVGAIYDDRTPVGAVHVGIVHLLQLAEPTVTVGEDILENAGFQPLSQLREQYHAFETWSQFLLDYWHK
ncbi:MAG: phosphoesterase [Zavarzinella sp.]